MTKLPASGPKIFFHLLVAASLYLSLNAIISASNPWLKAAVFMLYGTFVLIDFTKLLFMNRHGVAMAGAYLLFYVGCLLIFMFLLWFANTVAKFILNDLTVYFGIHSLGLGNIFSGIYRFLFSAPSLICGLILVLAGIIWDSREKRYRPFRAFLLLNL